MPDEISYHILTPDTAPLIETADIFDNPVDPTQLASFVSDPGHFMVFACVGTRAIGMASGTVLLHPDKQPACFVNEVGVMDDMQRRGIATTLCEQLFQHAQDLGCADIWLATETDNIAARGLYRKLKARETEGVVVYDWGGAMDP